MRIRSFREDDSFAAGRLIASTYEAFNLQEFPAASRAEMLGPFAHADSRAPVYRSAIAEAIASDTVLIADDDGEIVGILRGRPGRLASLFVAASHHRRGVGTALVRRFEQSRRAASGGRIRVASTLFAVPFYEAMGYRKTTGVRRMSSFDGEGLPYQPMQKTIPDS